MRGWELVALPTRQLWLEFEGGRMRLYWVVHENEELMLDALLMM
jgi:hypothetical protein